ncbi:MAG: endonuclease III [Verrucomicrobiota bacterium]|nr:endonuclease III [Verrucomicrobiota bacterium]
MFRETVSAKKARLKKIIARLDQTYPRAQCALTHANPLELLVATILSAQCTDRRVNLVTETLFKKYRSAEDYANAPVAELEQAIRSTGFYKNKARHIQAACRDIVEKHGGNVPRTMDDLLQLQGVGRKTANVVLGNAFGLNAGVVVDTHVARVSCRLGLTGQCAPEKIESDLMGLVPQRQWTLFSHWLIWHGRGRCHARKPDCAHCELLRLCRRIGVKEPSLPLKAGSNPGKGLLGFCR